MVIANIFLLKCRDDGPDFDIFFRLNHDNGETLEPFIDLSDNDGFSSSLIMVVAGNNVYVVWNNETNGGDFDISLE